MTLEQATKWLHKAEASVYFRAADVTVKVGDLRVIRPTLAEAITNHATLRRSELADIDALLAPVEEK